MITFRSMLPIPVLILALMFAAACGSGASDPRQVPVGPGSPTGPSPSGSVTLTRPAPVSPAEGEQLSTLRPTLTVQNTTSSQQTGTRTYEFQVSDNSGFTLGASLTASFLVAVNQTNVPEGADGRTAFMVPSELQPATRMYWRARAVQGTTSSDWTSTAMFKTKFVGYNRPGELYDPLIHPGESIGAISGQHEWIAGKGLRLVTENSYVQYQLMEVLTAGEFSVEVEGLRPNGPDHKLKIFSMNDTTGDLTSSNMQMSTMYRGLGGNPPNCISFKAVFGGGAPLEPDGTKREQSVAILDPGRTYFWKAIWSNQFRLIVADGGVNGSVIYDYGQSSSRSYRPAYAWLGSTQGVRNTDAGTFPGATYRNLWIGNRPRPTTLGNALD